MQCCKGNNSGPTDRRCRKDFYTSCLSGHWFYSTLPPRSLAPLLLLCCSPCWFPCFSSVVRNSSSLSIYMRTFPLKVDEMHLWAVLEACLIIVWSNASSLLKVKIHLRVVHQFRTHLQRQCNLSVRKICLTDYENWFNHFAWRGRCNELMRMMFFGVRLFNREPIEYILINMA